MVQEGKAVRENTVPQGGVYNPVVGGVVSGGMLLPDTHVLKQAANVFHENSEQNYLILDDKKLTPGRQAQIKLQNVGLGESMELFVEGSITLKNDSASDEVVTISPEFPFNLISNLNTMFNGKVQLNNLTGYDLLAIMAKRNPKNAFMFNQRESLTTDGVGSAPAVNPRVDQFTAYCYLERPAGDSTSTITAGDTLTGAKTLTLKASTSDIVLKFGFYLEIPFTFRKDIPLGLIPMQNNSVYANVTIMTSNVLGEDAESPLYTSVGDIAVTATDIVAKPTYNFWGIPEDPRLYAYFVNNSYVLTSYPKNPLNNTGAKALRFQFPLNYWLIAALFTIRDADKNLIDVYKNVDLPHIVYNGTTTVEISDIKTRTAREMQEYGRVFGFGQLMFDETSGVDVHTNSADTSKWINMYRANNPAFYANVDSGVNVPGEFDVLLEQLVPNYVKIL